MDQNSIPHLKELNLGEQLVVEWDNKSCLAGTSSYILEFTKGGDSVSVCIKTNERSVMPAEKTIRLSEEEMTAIGNLLCALPDCKSGKSLSYSSYRIALHCPGSHTANWEFKEIIGSEKPIESKKGVPAILTLLRLCSQVPRELRKPKIGERIGEWLRAGVILIVGFGLIAGVLWLLMRVWRLVFS
jgi:hypothetical protein